MVCLDFPFLMHQFLWWENLFGKPVWVSHCKNAGFCAFFIFIFIEHIRDIVYYLYWSIIIALISYQIICVLIGNCLGHSLLYWIYLDLCNIRNWVNCSIVKEMVKGTIGLGVSNWFTFVKWTVYIVRSCLVIVIISFCFVVLIENLLLARILIPLLLDLQSRINNIFIQDTELLT